MYTAFPCYNHFTEALTLLHAEEITLFRHLGLLPMRLRRSLQGKLVLLILLVAIIPLLTLGYVLYNKSSHTINEQFGRYGENTVSQLQVQIDSTLAQMKYTVEDILSYLLDPNFTVLHEEIPTTYLGFKEEQQLEQYIEAHKTLDTKGIFILTKSGYYYGERIANTNLVEESPWFGEERTGYLFSIYEPKQYSGTSNIPGEKVIGLLFRIHNQVGALEDARVLIEVKADKLLDMFQEYERDTGAFLNITDQGRVLYQTAKPYSKRDNDVVWTKQSEETDWKIEVRTPHSQFYQSSLLIRTFTFTAVSLSILLAFVLSYFSSMRFLSRIKKMKDSIRDVSLGRLHTRIAVDSEDEIGRLGRSFNHMVVQLQDLFGEVKRVERQKKEAELRALHHQINPHLLINTLASIQWKARIAGNSEVQQMILHLTKVLDGNLNYTRELVTLREELDVIHHYMNLQEYRFGHVFTYRIDPGDIPLEEVRIPRMTLQPLVENIFFHAFEDGEGMIEIKVRQQGTAIRLSVCDDGKGMDPAAAGDLLAEQGEETDGRKKRSIGIYNVDQRIKLHFGDKYGLDVESEPGKGTCIGIMLPKEET
ncbi:HAMP domain-containing protein [Paenibacillus sp. N10]|uniref:HAMP domain-containing protein n=1 Tax=Paenibacillus lutrae TaxID=2078573 RepID=A0A7X3FMJ1_9BACL|nr:HAMP domain-containing protein [Paenibacillus lutrae]